MSEEEKKAIEYLENQDNSLNWNYGTLQAIKTLLNLIEKYENYEYNKALIQQNNDLKIRIGEQQKEIEEKTTILFAGAEKVKTLEKEIRELKKEHGIMKRIIVDNGLWETLLNDDEFVNYLEEN